MSETERILSLLQSLAVGALSLLLVIPKARFSRRLRAPVAVVAMIVCLTHLIVMFA